MLSELKVLQADVGMSKQVSFMASRSEQTIVDNSGHHAPAHVGSGHGSRT